MGRCPLEGDAVVSVCDGIPNPNGPPGPTLSWASAVMLDPAYHCLGIRENRVSLTTLISAVEDPQGLMNSEDLCVEDLLISPQVGPCPLLDAIFVKHRCCSHLPIF